jgi:hypothetical protein
MWANLLYVPTEDAIEIFGSDGFFMVLEMTIADWPVEGFAVNYRITAGRFVNRQIHRTNFPRSFCMTI